MIYLTKFETTAAYEAAKDNLAKPQVTLITETNGVAYQPYTPPDPYAGHEYVDLGLPSGTKWATMNIAIEQYSNGSYYQYGKGADSYQVTSGDSNYSGTENPLAASADTAAQVWGGAWHIPTKAQFEELIANTTFSWTTVGYTEGAKFTAQNGNYVFLASGGIYDDGYLNDFGACFYHTSTPNDSNTAYIFGTSNYGSLAVYSAYRSSGMFVRPVVG